MPAQTRRTQCLTPPPTPQRPPGHSWTLLSSTEEHHSAHLPMLHNALQCIDSIHNTQYTYTSKYTYNSTTDTQLKLNGLIVQTAPLLAISYYFCICTTIATFCYPRLHCYPAQSTVLVTRDTEHSIVLANKIHLVYSIATEELSYHANAPQSN